MVRVEMLGKALNDYEYWSTTPLAAHLPTNKRKKLWRRMDSTRPSDNRAGIPYVSLLQYLREVERNSCQYEEFMPLIERENLIIDGKEKTFSEWMKKNEGDLLPIDAIPKGVAEKLRKQGVIVRVCSAKGKGYEEGPDSCKEWMWALSPAIKMSGVAEDLSGMGLNLVSQDVKVVHPSEEIKNKEQCEQWGGKYREVDVPYNSSKVCLFKVCGVPMPVRRYLAGKGYWFKHGDDSNAHYLDKKKIPRKKKIGAILKGRMLKLYQRSTKPKSVPTLKESKQNEKYKWIIDSGKVVKFPLGHYKNADIRFPQGRWIQDRQKDCLEGKIKDKEFCEFIERTDTEDKDYVV